MTIPFTPPREDVEAPRTAPEKTWTTGVSLATLRKIRLTLMDMKAARDAGDDDIMWAKSTLACAMIDRAYEDVQTWQDRRALRVMTNLHDVTLRYREVSEKKS